MIWFMFLGNMQSFFYFLVRIFLSYFGGQIVLTAAEHHSAIVPWQFVSQKTGATLKYVGLTKEEVPDIEQLKALLSNKTKIVVVHHVSNVLGKSFFIWKENWMLVGDFNFYRSLSDRNKSGGNMNDIMIFNEIISNLGLLEIPLKERKFFWSNMQRVCLVCGVTPCFMRWCVMSSSHEF